MKRNPLRQPNMKLLIAFTSLAIFANLSLAAPEPHSKGSHSPEASWKAFHAALQAPDDESLLSFIQFPLETNMTAIPGFENASSKEGFVTHIESLFPREARTALLKLESSEVFQPSNLRETASGKGWRVAYHDGPDEEGFESSILYTFEKTDSGTVKLVAIDVAG